MGSQAWSGSNKLCGDHLLRTDLLPESVSKPLLFACFYRHVRFRVLRVGLFVAGLAASVLIGVDVSHAAEVQSDDVYPNVREDGPGLESPQDEQGRFKRIENVRRQLKRTLAILSAENGTDPTAVIGQLSPRTRYQSREKDQRIQEIFRATLPLSPTWLLRVDAPFTYLDPKTSDEQSVAGLGDVRVRFGGRVLHTDDGSILLGTEIYFPTATNSRLGSGEFRVGPTVVGSYHLADWRSTAYIWVEYLTGVSGQIGEGFRNGLSADDSSTNEVRIRNRFNTVWTKTWWSFVESRLFIDLEKNSKTGAVLVFEGGRRLDKHWRVYLRPEVGLWGRSVPGAFDYGVELGVRYMFYVF